MFFAHMGCTAALRANRNNIVFYLLKSSLKCRENEGKKFAKKLHFYVILFFTLQIFYNIFCNFQ